MGGLLEKLVVGSRWSVVGAHPVVEAVGMRPLLLEESGVAISSIAGTRKVRAQYTVARLPTTDY